MSFFSRHNPRYTYPTSKSNSKSVNHLEGRTTYTQNVKICIAFFRLHFNISKEKMTYMLLEPPSNMICDNSLIYMNLSTGHAIKLLPQAKAPKIIVSKISPERLIFKIGLVLKDLVTLSSVDKDHQSEKTNRTFACFDPSRELVISNEAYRFWQAYIDSLSKLLTETDRISVFKDFYIYRNLQQKRCYILRRDSVCTKIPCSYICVV